METSERNRGYRDLEKKNACGPLFCFKKIFLVLELKLLNLFLKILKIYV